MSNLGIAPATVALLTAALAAPYLALLVDVWLGESKSGAASFVAFAGAVAIAWRERRKLTKGPCRRPKFGIAILAAATALYVASFELDVWAGIALFAPLAVAATVYLELGGRTLRVLGFSWLLLALAAPAPAGILDFITAALLGCATTIAGAVLPWFVGEVVAEGYVLHFHSGSIAVVEDCSGMAGVLLFVPLGVLLVYAHPGLGWWRALTVVALGPVLAMLASLLRVLVTGLAVHWQLEFATAGGGHELVGVVTLAFALIGLVVVCRLWSRRVSRRIAT